MLHGDYILVFQWSYRNLRRIGQVFRNIVFCRADFYIYMQILFHDRFENVLFYFLFCECF